MKSKLLSAVAMPALLAIGAATAFAQEAPQSPSPSPSAPAENMPSTSPSPAPAPSAEPSAVAPAPTAEAPSATTTAGTFSSNQAADEWRSTKLVGLGVYNQANEKVGDVNDLILGPDGKISNAVIGVGGFLGMGEKLVAVAFSDLQLNRDADGTMRVTINSTKEALESAPDFKYFTDTKKAE
ncbi:PRC-barrel domain-containing protein [uncultured Hyphomicrobium sp.]|uniref:PRC-barrel domain-containing protein n=1 Tax=uncultured Hyphomicrobium sp. TaxID=194373 RepID=UPI0026000C5F|nr:PRC-barrel domain-containing protein [uncultured Hyphomicrobium sp.]